MYEEQIILEKVGVVPSTPDELRQVADRLDADDLRWLRRLWYRQAVERGDIELIGCAARWFGRNLNAMYGPRYEYEYRLPDGDLVIIHRDEYGGFSTARLITPDGRDRQVMNTHDSERLFVPGAWVKALTQRGEMAKALRRRQEKECNERERASLMEALLI